MSELNSNMNKKYWGSIHELRDATYTEKYEDGDLEYLKEVREVISKEKTGRRDFLKMLGFSVGAATVAAACKRPIRKSIPYQTTQDGLVPGIPNYYASAYTANGDFNSVKVKCREGRPILLEGLSSGYSRGDVHLRALGSLINLYDHARIKSPKIDGKDISWEKLDTSVIANLKKADSDGKEVVLLTGTEISPSVSKAYKVLQEAYPNIEHIQYDPISYSGILDAHKEMFGKRSIREIYFDRADLIVSVGADFLGSWISPTRFSTEYVSRRKVSKENTNMNRHIQVESVPSLAGSNADLRIPLMPSEEHLALVQIYNHIAEKLGEETVHVSFDDSRIASVAEELLACQGNSVLISGSNDKDAQILVILINTMLGNYGNTISNFVTYNLKQGDDNALNDMFLRMANGEISGIIIDDSNPFYNLGDDFEKAFSNLNFSISLSSRFNETSRRCTYIAPDNHWLESWGDAMPTTNYLASCQPCIAPLFDTRQRLESVLRWSGQSLSAYDFIRKVWFSEYFQQQSTYSTTGSFWDSTIHDGGVELKNLDSEVKTVKTSNINSVQRLAETSTSKMEVRFYEKPQIGDGHYCDNPWMQELADPITRISWDNYIVANPKWVEENNLLDNFKARTYQRVMLKTNKGTVTLPIVALPGTPYGSFGICFGYGRKHTLHSDYERGASIYHLTNREGNSMKFTDEVNEVKWVEDGYKVAIIQQHHGLTHKTLGSDDESMFVTEQTRQVVKETTLAEYKEDPWSGNTIAGQRRDKWLKHHLTSLYGETAWDDDKPFEYYYGGAHAKKQGDGHHWGLAIDLNACTGCGACVVACHAENNVPIVGQEEVHRGHEMNWVRIDKYHTGDEDNPDVVFQLMMCQHCDNAPCENVCPVAATNHSSEGLNQMTYNRCIGTRYCANNCPYKVRRFNWFDYQGADSFSDREGFWGLDNDFDGARSHEGGQLGMHDPLRRMVLNPDVTIRSRGVIEKCSLCVQRIQLAKLEAKIEKRGLDDETIRTACQTACGADAIVFGDTNNQQSEVFKKWSDERAFGVIEEIHTLPSVQYLTKVRNKTKKSQT